MKTDRLAHSSLDAVALDGSPQGSSDGEPDTRPWRFRQGSRQIEGGQQSRKMSLPILVYVLKIGMFQQLYRFRKPCCSFRLSAKGFL